MVRVTREGGQCTKTYLKPLGDVTICLVYARIDDAEDVTRRNDLIVRAGKETGHNHIPRSQHTDSIRSHGVTAEISQNDNSLSVLELFALGRSELRMTKNTPHSDQESDTQRHCFR